MKPTALIVADAARCRFFTLTSADTPNIESTVVLQEVEDLVNPEANASGQQVYSNTKSGRNRAPAGGPAHGYDDHREGHQQELRRRFARTIDQRAARLMAQEQGGLVVIAEPRLLGLLRQEFSQDLRERIVLELAEDASKQGVVELLGLLEASGMLSAAPRPTASYRPRGQE